MTTTTRGVIGALALTAIVWHGLAAGQEPPARGQAPSRTASAAEAESTRQAPAAPSVAELNALRDENQRLKRTIELLQRKTQLLEQRVRELEGAR